MNTPARLPPPTEEPEPASAPTAAAMASASSRELRYGAYIHYGKYRIEEVLGRGSFAVVYAAEHVALRRPVAIKVLHVTADTGRGLIARFQREAQTAALVRHPNVLETYDSGTLGDGSPFLVLERADGGTLAERLKRGPLAMSTALDMARQLARGLCAVIEAGIIHRDLKPDNVMLHNDHDGAPLVKIVDFGVSKRLAPHAVGLTAQGELVGTPQYMSPEQLRGEDIDARADVYGLGALLYEAITGHAPHERKNLGDLMVAVLHERVRPPRELRPDCPVEFEAVLLKALARDRGQRFASPSELLQALEQITLPQRRDDTPHSMAIATRQANSLELDLTAPPIQQFASQLRAAVEVGATHARSLRSYGPQGLRLAGAVLVTALVIAAGLTLMKGDRSAPAVPSSDGVAVAPSAPSAPSAAAREPVSAAGSTRPPAPLEPQTANETAKSPSASALPRPEQHAAVRDAPPRMAPAAARPSGAAVPKSAQPAASTPPAAKRASAPQAARPAAAPTAARAAAAQPAKRAAQPAKTGAAKTVSGGEPVAESATAPSPSAASEAPDGAWQSAMRNGLSALVSGNAVSARAHYREAVRLAPAQATGYRGLALSAARLGERDEAQRALTRYLELAPGAADGPSIAARIAALPPAP